MPHAFLIIAITSLLSLIGIYGYFVWMLQPAIPLWGIMGGWFYGEGSKIKVKGVKQVYTPC
jgi:hypothetical protein